MDQGNTELSAEAKLSLILVVSSATFYASLGFLYVCVCGCTHMYLIIRTCMHIHTNVFEK